MRVKTFTVDIAFSKTRFNYDCLTDSLEEIVGWATFCEQLPVIEAATRAM